MTTLLDEIFADRPLMLILRGIERAHTLELCEIAWAAGIHAVEIPVQSPEAVSTLREAASLAHRNGRIVGAGTVVTEAQVEQAHDAGARFTVAPGFDTHISATCAQRGLAHIPGVATATEIARAMAAGHTWLKAFPARELGPSWIAAQMGPFPEVRFVATGGLSSANAAAFLQAGARVVALGSAIADPEELQRCIAAGETPLNEVTVAPAVERHEQHDLSTRQA